MDFTILIICIRDYFLKLQFLLSIKKKNYLHLCVEKEINLIRAKKEYLIENNLYDLKKEKIYILNTSSDNFIHPDCLLKQTNIFNTFFADYTFNKLFQQFKISSKIYKIVASLFSSLKDNNNNLFNQNNFNAENNVIHRISKFEISWDFNIKNYKEIFNKFKSGFKMWGNSVENSKYNSIRTELNKNEILVSYIKAINLLRKEARINTSNSKHIFPNLIFNSSRDFREKMNAYAIKYFNIFSEIERISNENLYEIKNKSGLYLFLELLDILVKENPKLNLCDYQYLINDIVENNGILNFSKNNKNRKIGTYYESFRKVLFSLDIIKKIGKNWVIKKRYRNIFLKFNH